jgi:hypothetical protein
MGCLSTAASGYKENLYNATIIFDIFNCLRHILTHAPCVMRGPVSKQHYDQLLLGNNL